MDTQENNVIIYSKEDCMPCVKMKKIVCELIIDMFKDLDITIKFISNKESIKSIDVFPTIVFVKKQHVVGITQGISPKQLIINELNKLKE
jgi:glutaredoxin